MKYATLKFWLIGSVLAMPGARAFASTIVYDLNTKIDGGPPVSSVTSFGTVTVDSVAANPPTIPNAGVQFTIDLNRAYATKVGELDLNFGTTPTPTTFTSPQNVVGGIVDTIDTTTPPAD